MTYKEQYLHPKWQKKRLEYFEYFKKKYSTEDLFCEICQEDEKQLSLHHKIYLPNHKIWEYEDDNFLLLCNECHEYLHSNMKDISIIIQNNFCDNIGSICNIINLIRELNPFEIDCIYDIINMIISIKK